MTRQEHDTFEHCPCPCGGGHVLRHVDSTDYRHSSVHVSYSIGCSQCSRSWRIDHGTLVLRESEVHYISTKAAADLARERLHALAQQLVKTYCEALAFKSMKAELEHLLTLNLSQAKYAAYTKERRAGKAMHELAYGLRSVPWLVERAEEDGKAVAFAELLGTSEAARAKLEAASKQIVRRSLKGACPDA